VVLSAAYLLWAYQRMFTGPVAPEHRVLADLNGREWAALAPCALLTLVIGVYPAAITRIVGPSCDLLAHHLAWIAAR
jgi:NADH-quinone oxidoreductase subunit M